MRDEPVLELADCTELRLALQARPPRVVHGTMILLAALLAAATAWAATTHADLVVLGPGRIRPATTPVKVFNGARGDSLSASAGTRVVAVHAREGDRVRRGAVLVRLAADRIENEIAKQTRLIRAAEEELAKLVDAEDLLRRQHQATRAKVEAELESVREGIRLAGGQRDAEIRLAQVILRAAEADEAPLRRLAGRGYATQAELNQATAKAGDARERLAKARLPIDESRPIVLLRALEVEDRDYAVRCEELGQKRRTKRAEVESARIELASLELERGQAVIVSPIVGVVTAGDLKVGDVLEPGKPVAEVAAQDGFVFEAAVPSAEVGHLRLGMFARVKLDAYDYQRYGTLAGTVCFLSPDSGIEEGQKARLYKVRIAVPRSELGRGVHRGQAKLGMGGQAEIITGRESVLSLLVKGVRRTISLG